MIPSHINSLIFCWGAENSYFLEPRKAATVHQIWKLGHLFRLLRGNVDVNIQLENVSTASSVRKESRSYNYYSLFFQSIFKLAFLLFFLAAFFFSPSPTDSGITVCWLISVMVPLWHSSFPDLFSVLLPLKVEIYTTQKSSLPLLFSLCYHIQGEL